MRNACFDALHRLARRDERVVFIGSDLGSGTLDGFRAELPERFFMEGVSEANIVGLAAGLAMEGFIPYVATIATFMTRRCHEQIANDLCLHRLPVRLIGIGGGLAYAPLGPTHMAIDDLAILGVLPEMGVVAPADADEMTAAVNASADWPGPLYIRIGRGGSRSAGSQSHHLSIGSAHMARAGADGLFVTTGITRDHALDAAANLEADGLAIGVLHLPTVKPLNVDALLAALATAPGAVVSVEEHSVVGGLGSAVGTLIAEADLARPPRFRRVGVPELFPHGYGSQDTLMAEYGMTATGLARTMRALLGLDARAPARVAGARS